VSGIREIFDGAKKYRAQSATGASSRLETMDPAARALIDSALGGDESAFEELIRAHSRRLFAIAYGVLQNGGEAEDVVQETFVKAWRLRRKVREAERFEPWLTTIARNGALDVLRRRRSVPLDEAGGDFPSEAGAPGSGLDEAARDACVHRALATLPEHYRVALSLRYLEGLDCRAVETAMGLSNGALRGILGRALETLRRALRPAATELLEP
jgi:RNA polymerase sigma-70 factor (ECF subfamily)